MRLGLSSVSIKEYANAYTPLSYMLFSSIRFSCMQVWQNVKKLKRKRIVTENVLKLLYMQEVNSNRDQMSIFPVSKS